MNDMAQVNFRVDYELKLRAEKVCEDMGMNMTTAINIFLVNRFIRVGLCISNSSLFITKIQ